MLYYFGEIYLTWIGFLAVMSLKAAQDAGKLSKLVEGLAIPLIITAVMLDALSNLLASLPFLEFPREPLLTARCSRHMHDELGWRKSLAGWLCHNLLDPFQSGGHCH